MPYIMAACTLCVMIGLGLMMDRCSVRNQEFRVECVKANGTLVASGANLTCVVGTKVTKS